MCKFGRATTTIRRWQVTILTVATALAVLHPPATPARAETIHVEGFNDDGDGVRYSTLGRGTFSDLFGDAFWEHNFIVGDVAPKFVAPARRVGFLWDDFFSASEWSSNVAAVWDASVDWALDGKASANIAFADPDIFLEPSDAVMVSRMQSQGHTVTIVDGFFEPNPAGLDLLVISPDANPVGYDFPVPILSTASAGYSDSLHLTSDTFVFAFDSRLLAVTDPAHPIAAGRSGSISWTETEQSLGFLPLLAAPGATTVVTDAYFAIPAVVALEQGGELLGGDFRGWEGGGFFAGQDLGAPFPPGYNSSIPRVLQLAPVDVSGKQDVKFTASLAATRGFFADGDYINVLIDPENDGTFQLVTTFQADYDSNLSDVTNLSDIVGPDTVTLSRAIAPHWVICDALGKTFAGS